jgi:tRNA-Thr(GGU) m(6)t(6)A37 methyltransferase TsaA
VQISVEAIGYVSSTRRDPVDDDWDLEESSIVLVAAYSPEALAGLMSFSHIEVLYVFHQVEPGDTVAGARHPRGNAAWPRTGIFAQRGKNRPNRLGSTICRVVGVEALTVRVSGLDAIDGTPVLDIKPIMREFLPRGEVNQPPWSSELMREYWSKSGNT